MDGKWRIFSSSVSVWLGKPLANMATGMASGTAAMLNHNYVIGQPPGFQLAAFVSTNASKCLSSELLTFFLCSTKVTSHLKYPVAANFGCRLNWQVF